MRNVLPSLLLALTLLAACDDQQVLYVVDSPEPIPEVPSLAQHAADPHSGARLPDEPGIMPGAAGALPPPEPTEFRPQDLTEPLRETELVGLRFPLPERYQRANEAGEMRLAQWTVPARRGTGTGELVAFYFGPGQGGGAMENAMRWLRQFQPAEGAETPLVSLQQGYPPGLVITRAVMEGFYDPGQMSQSATPPQPGEVWRMDALVIEGGPQGTLFLRLTGPAELVRAETGAILHAAALMAPTDVSPPAPPAADRTSTQRVGVKGVSFAFPAHWRTQAPASAMRAIQFEIPTSAGQDAVEFVIFHFGPGGGGSAADNIARWNGQVKADDGSPAPAETDHRHVGSFHIDVIYAEGTYAPTAMGPMMPAPTPKANQALYGAVIEGGPEGALYLRATGPAEAVQTLRPTLDAVLRSLE